ncbi:hypothetical protein [Pseudomonas carnis]|uniref:hypothetical protein n=1 Tax=Pseudomonas carnis TaxID=2487355 RepID=UPI0015E27FDB|nr:hypothetical protein [Pseudomonas carnis]MBA1301384.1 hypothetical protein [Pseudomonas carnis]MBJ2203964.1 hypothetical protein [Pseudomonas carnis]
MTTDKVDLKALAEACDGHQPLRYMRSHGALYIRNDSGIVFDVHQNRSFPDLMAQNKDYADFALACTPSTILGLFAEIDRLESINLGQMRCNLSQRSRRKAEVSRAEKAEDEALDLAEQVKGLEVALVHMREERDIFRLKVEEFDKTVAGIPALARTERIRAENESLKKDLQSHKRMLLAAACDIGAIGQALGAEMDDDGSCIEGLAQEVRRDADRYGWVRTRLLGDLAQFGVFRQLPTAINEEVLDIAIDLALAEERGQ